ILNSFTHTTAFAYGSFVPLPQGTRLVSSPAPQLTTRVATFTTTDNRSGRRVRLFRRRLQDMGRWYFR
ncbi:unnamed protein product, partial [Mycena citricolor]